MEDALKRLDKLTHEEARMAIAQNLKATHVVEDKVIVVGDAVRSVDTKVADGVKAVIDGAQMVFNSSPKINELWCPRWKRDEDSCRSSETFVVPWPH